jgi:hypothetical protein
MDTAAYYRQKAGEMRARAESAANPGLRNQLLELAAEYEKLAESAEAREPKP